MTFRNRCVIAGANGQINLSVPIVGGRNTRSLTSEVLIDNRLSWQKNHWKSICSCYNHAPWFEQYLDGCREIFETRFERLTDLNRTVFEWLAKQLNMSISVKEGVLPEGIDCRNILNVFTPKTVKQFPAGMSYRQVFQERTGFLAHLSALDLLFCTGPRAGELLRSTPSFIL